MVDLSQVDAAQGARSTESVESRAHIEALAEAKRAEALQEAKHMVEQAAHAVAIDDAFGFKMRFAQARSAMADYSAWDRVIATLKSDDL